MQVHLKKRAPLLFLENTNYKTFNLRRHSSFFIQSCFINLNVNVKFKILHTNMYLGLSILEYKEMCVGNTNVTCFVNKIISLYIHDKMHGARVRTCRNNHIFPVALYID